MPFNAKILLSAIVLGTIATLISLGRKFVFARDALDECVRDESCRDRVLNILTIECIVVTILHPIMTVLWWMILYFPTAQKIGLPLPNRT